MADYRSRVDGSELAVQAFRFMGVDPEGYPDWFRYLIESGGARVSGRLESATYARLVRPDRTDLAVSVGDYIIRNPDGFVFPLTERQFKSQFEKRGHYAQRVHDSDSVTCPSCDKKSVEKYCGACGLDLQGDPWDVVRRHLIRSCGPGQDMTELIWKACENYHGIVEPKKGD